MAHTINITTTGNALGQYCVKFGDQINQTVRTGLELEGALPKIDCDYAYQGQDVTVFRYHPAIPKGIYSQ
jgi:hypothetical protein